MKSYNLILNSRNKQSGTGSNAKYLVNWAFLPSNKKYKLSFSFQSKVVVSDGSSLVMLSIPLTASAQTFTTSSTSSSYLYSNILGSMSVETITKTTGFDNILRATYTDNPPVYIETAPTNNEVQVALLQADNSYFTAMDLVEYVCILHFQEEE